MQEADDDGTGATGGAERGASVQDGPDGPGGPPDPVDALQEADGSNHAPPNQPTVTGPEVVGPVAPGSQERLLQVTVTVPYPLALEAEIAQHYLMMKARRLGPVRKVFSVEENVFTVRLLSVDPLQLEISIIACLEQLAKVVRRMLRHLKPSSCQPRNSKRG